MAKLQITIIVDKTFDPDDYESEERKGENMTPEEILDELVDGLNNAEISLDEFADASLSSITAITVSGILLSED